MSRKKPEEKTSPETAAGFKEMVEQIWKPAAEQWDHWLRNPVFLSMMAAAMEQSMNLTVRVQELVATTMKTMNLATRDDIRELKQSLQALREDVAELHGKIDGLPPQAGSTKRKRRSRKRS